jgi:CHAT domain-containing protein
VAGGEGVFGLQRAFHPAGAQNVVASLWKVDDIATLALMKLFYRQLWQEKQPPMVALRQAQLHIYRHPDEIARIAGLAPQELAKQKLRGLDVSDAQPSDTPRPADPFPASHRRYPPLGCNCAQRRGVVAR